MADETKEKVKGVSDVADAKEAVADKGRKSSGVKEEKKKPKTLKELIYQRELEAAKRREEILELERRLHKRTLK